MHDVTRGQAMREVIDDQVIDDAIPEQADPPAAETIDEELSLGDSLSLHMLSEHQVVGDVHLDDHALHGAHENLHAECELDHLADDLSFRSKLALDVALGGRTDLTDQ